MLIWQGIKENLPTKVSDGLRFKCLPLCVSALVLAGCVEASAPAPVLNLGLNSDSRTGSILASSGDTLWSISKRYRVPLRAIIDMNNISSPYNLSKGQRLKIPAPLDYKVMQGDTLYSIANMFEVSVYELVRVNNLSRPYVIGVDQHLRIPSKYSDYDRNIAVAKSSNKINYKKKYTKANAGVKDNKLIRKTPAKPRPKNIVVKGGKGKFSWPVKGKIISSYGAKKNGLYNDGINIAVPKRAPVLAASNGVVAYVGADIKSYGNLVLIKHAGGVTTAYAHLDNIKVKKGDKVKRRQVIGAAGSTGNVSTSQLHFEIRRGSKTYNPADYL